MTELRQNMATKEWVVIARERVKRPDDYVTAQTPVIDSSLPDYDPHCPFCPGNEEFDLEVARYPVNGAWQTRVVNNRYPALSVEGELVRT